ARPVAAVRADLRHDRRAGAGRGGRRRGRAVTGPAGIADGPGADDHPAIGIDIGGTNLRAAVVDAAGAVLDTVSVGTPHDPASLDTALVDVIGTLAARRPVSAVGLAVAGFISRDQQVVRFAPHLPWRDSAVPARLAPRVGLPVY